MLLLLMVLAAVVAVGAAARDDRGDHGSGRALGRAVGDGRPAPTFELVTTTTRPATLPVPETLPSDPYAPTPPVVVGTIEIPKLGVRAELQRGMTLTAIDRGPSWWPGTALPGEWGNVVVAGHRTTHSKPFARLHELVPGDRVVFTVGGERFDYEVRGVITVPAEWIDIAAQDWAHTATLFACHPPGSARERIVAKLRLLGPDGAPVDPDEALPPLDAEARRPDHTLVMRDPATGGTPPGDDGAGADPFRGVRG